MSTPSGVSPAGSGSPISIGSTPASTSTAAVGAAGPASSERIASHAPPAPSENKRSPAPIRIAHVAPGERTPIASSEIREPLIVVVVAGAGAGAGAPPELSVVAPDALRIGPPGSPVLAMRAPHMLQKRASAVFRAPHAWQKTIAAGG
jgi:hypothetical protein